MVAWVLSNLENPQSPVCKESLPRSSSSSDQATEQPEQPEQPKQPEQPATNWEATTDCRLLAGSGHTLTTLLTLSHPTLPYPTTLTLSSLVLPCLLLSNAEGEPTIYLTYHLPSSRFLFVIRFTPYRIFFIFSLLFFPFLLFHLSWSSDHCRSLPGLCIYEIELCRNISFLIVTTEIQPREKKTIGKKRRIEREREEERQKNKIPGPHETNRNWGTKQLLVLFITTHYPPSLI